MDFLATKASFVAGLVLIITIIKDITELYMIIPNWMFGCYVIICILVFYLILGTKLFDSKMKPRGVSNYGNFLTLMSVAFFVIENSIIRYKEIFGDLETKICVTTLGIIVILGAIYLLWEGRKRF